MLDKIKQLGKDTAIYGISTIVGRFLNFLLVPLYTHFIVPSEYGILGNVYANIAFINIIFIYGLDVAYMKFASLNKDEDKSYFSLAQISIFLSSLILSGLILSLKNPILSYFNASSDYSYIVYLVAPIVFLDALSVVPFANLRLKRKAKKFALIRFFNIVINISTNLYLFIYLEMGMESIFISNLVASSFSLICLLPDIYKTLDFKFDLSKYKTLLKFGITFLPASLTSMIIQAIDKPLMANLADNQTAGIYNVNYKLGILMMLFVTMFQYAWQPFFLDNSKDENSKPLFAKILTLFMLFMSTVWVFLLIFINDIVQLQLPGRGTLINEAYWSGTVIVPVILLAYVFNGIYVNLQAGIVIENKTKYLFVITLLGALSNLAINLIFIPKYNIWAGAFAALISYILMAVGLFFLSRKFYKIDYEYKKIFLIFFSMGIISFLFYQFNDLWNGKIINKLLLFLSFPILIFIFKIYSVNQIKELVKKLIKRK